MTKKTFIEEDGMVADAGRAVLDAASDFTNEGKAIGEYVKNSWQYTGNHAKVEIFVDQENKTIQIKDNSEGMDLNTLQTRFFVLHKRNIDRQRGKLKRGEHGTGKSAALGIGDILRVSTIKNNILNEFEIHRKDCEDEEISLKKVPIRWLHKEKSKVASNGTTVTIEGWAYKRDISINNIKEFLKTKTLPERRAYSHSNKGKEIETKISLFINGDEIKEEQIPYSREKIIEFNDEEKKYYEDINFILRIADRKLKQHEQGVRIFSNGILRAFIKTPTANKSEFIFGECECPKLMKENNPPIFDSSRNEQINEDNEFGLNFKNFISKNVDILRKELEKQDKDRRQKEKNEITKKEEEKMKNFFNSIFKEQQLEFEKIAARVRGSIDKKDDFVPELGETKIVVGKEFGAKIVDGDDGANILDIKSTPHMPDPVDPNPNPKGSGKLEKNLNDPNTNAKERKSRRKQSGGGFDFQYKYDGKEEDRATYDRENRVITVNLEHPFIEKLHKACNEDKSTPKFRRGAYEAAAVEFAAAVTLMKQTSNLADNTLDSGVTSVQKILDDVLRKMSNLDIFDE